MRRHRLLAFILSIATLPAAFAAPAPPIVVFAAASLSDLLQDLANAYARKTQQTVTLSFAASSSLAKQVEGGAPADVFLSADTEWMDYLEQRHLIDPGSRRNLLRNRLALIAPSASTVKLEIAPSFPLAQALGKGRLAVGDPESVPAGRYARYALISLGVWNSVSERLVPAENVRSALAFVARGEAPLGIVYETDAVREKDVRIVGIFPANSHPQIVYPIALTPQAKAGSARFVEFMRGPDGRQIFSRFGFKPAQ